MAAFENAVGSTISRWHGIKPPNEPAKRLAAELADTIEAFAALRGQIAFEDEPSSFEAALQATKEGAPLYAPGSMRPPETAPARNPAAKATSLGAGREGGA